jgi:hypothetical protein
VLARETALAGKVLVERLAIYPVYARLADTWLDPALRSAVMRASDGAGFARTISWIAGGPNKPAAETRFAVLHNEVDAIVARAMAGRALTDADVIILIASRGDAFHVVCERVRCARRTAATMSDSKLKNLRNHVPRTQGMMNAPSGSPPAVLPLFETSSNSIACLIETSEASALQRRDMNKDAANSKQP